MKNSNKKKLLTVASLAALALVLGRFTTSERQVDYSADVKPILNKKCISCHGGVKAKGGFSVLFREEALAKTESGKYAVIPGDADGSEMIRRINHKDPEERMPYKHEKLSEEEISILTRWIDQGAKWGDHWAYVPVKKVSVPDVQNEWIKNDIDRFILQKLEEQQLQPSGEADKATLLRRVSLDLIGMYPSESIAQQFLRSNDPNAYEILVDSLLASPRYGERWASMWLDLARYADSKGYEADRQREIWKYRDWVIRAFNHNMPYDQFLKEQLAGDLLPNPTDDQFIATAFNRNSMTNDEGGTDNEEFRTAATLDRVNTTWEALMGTTFSCVQCHSHPYDPFRHEEYYSFVAYFNNTRDEDQYPEYPFLRTYPAPQKEQVEKLTSWVAQHSGDDQAKQVELFVRTLQPAIYGSRADSMVNAFLDGNNGPVVMRNYSSLRFKNIDLNNVDQLIFNANTEATGGRLTIRVDAPDGPVIGSITLPETSRTEIFSLPLSGDNQTHDIYLSFVNSSLPKIHKKDRIYFEWFAFNKSLPKGEPGYEENKKIFWDLIKSDVETVPVLVENPSTLKRKTFVFERGNRMTLGNEVQPRVPNSLSAAMPANAPADRRGLVMWLTDKKNPLVSRTLVNRFWEQLFGTGIVETLEDMGTQGIPPTHQELLDHYSWKLMNDYRWDMKKLIKELVMSATYRQDSKFTEDKREKDPFNRYYSRASRLRLHAEQLRDQHLCISGTISNRMYGPGVMPWQPEGIWSNPYNSESWKNSKGEDQYRRSIYTFVKRTAGYPSMITFDGSSRIVCTPRRIRTNTPLQALVTLNDSAYIDMAAHFSTRMMEEGGDDVRSQIARGYEIMLYKPIPDEKMKVLTRLYDEAFKEYSGNIDLAARFAGVSRKEKDIAHRAALKVVANAMLNFEEVITKS